MSEYCREHEIYMETGKCPQCQLEENTGEDYTEEFINKALEGIAKDFCDKKRALYILNKIDEGQCGIKAWDLICDAKDYLK